ncbi:hypothetical protein WMF31_11595 [Sorangium sp. So ce1036]|uniref:tetratricopeptide repeat protein n=1 Tax=Sorangium sp. So ce1036 TaxID=3133328 RepID=UPI003F0A3AE3
MRGEARPTAPSRRPRRRGPRLRGLACAFAAVSLPLWPASGAAGEPAAAGEPGAAGEPAAGHKDQVLALYQVARELLEAGRAAEACAVLEQGRRLDPTAMNLLLRLGDCLARTGRTASAFNVFNEAAAVARSAGDSRAARAATLAAELEPRLSRLEIAVPAADAPPGLEIRRDGVLVLPEQWGQPIPVDPGPHTIEARAPGRKRWSVTHTVAPDGGRVVVDVPVLEQEPPPLRAGAPVALGQAPPALPLAVARGRGAGDRDRGAGGAQRLVALASGGVGLVGLGVGAVFGAQALARRDASNRGHCDAQNRCDAAGVALRADAQAAGTASTIAFSSGAAALLAAGLLYWTAPRRPAGAPARGATVTAVAAPGAFSLVAGGSY